MSAMCQNTDNPQRLVKICPATSRYGCTSLFSGSGPGCLLSPDLRHSPETNTLASLPFRALVLGYSGITDVCGQLLFSLKICMKSIRPSEMPLLLTWKQMPLCCCGKPRFIFWRELSANSILIPRRGHQDWDDWNLHFQMHDFFLLLFFFAVKQKHFKWAL